VVALYDRSATVYDEVKDVRPEDDAQHLALPLLERLNGVPSPLVLDVATGSGRLPLTLLRQWEFSGRVVGLDLSRGMLGVAKRRTGAQRQRCALVRQDASRLPFGDGVFHAVTCIEALEFLPNPRQALQEMARVLVPGGHVLISNRVGPDTLLLPGRAWQASTLEGTLQGLGLSDVQTRRWQVHYDLIAAEKPGDPVSVGEPSPRATLGCRWP
jgi:ubiquinone/menaquinone biosynthesis C-methylase UbiE